MGVDYDIGSLVGSGTGVGEVEDGVDEGEGVERLEDGRFGDPMVVPRHSSSAAGLGARVEMSVHCRFVLDGETALSVLVSCHRSEGSDAVE